MDGTLPLEALTYAGMVLLALGFLGILFGMSYAEAKKPRDLITVSVLQARSSKARVAFNKSYPLSVRFGLHRQTGVVTSDFDLADTEAADFHIVAHGYGVPGPNQGDSAQPRSDVGGTGNTNGDSGGELTNGIFGGSYLDPTHDTVAFNEYHGANAGTDTGDEQPRIDFDLGGTYDLNTTRIVYWTGGSGALVGPELVEISVSTDGGLTYSASPDFSYSGFDRTDTGSIYSASDTIPIAASGVTNVRMDFFQGNYSVSPL